MIIYFSTNILLSALLFIALYLMKSAPFRLKFRLIIFSLLSWFIPYDLIHNLFGNFQIIQFSSEILLATENLKNSVNPQLTQIKNNVSLWEISIVLSFVGLLIFIKDTIILRKKIQKQLLNANHFKTISGIKCYSLLGLDAAFVSGIKDPVILIDDKYRQHPNLNSLLQHEQQHIIHNDHIWLLLIGLMQKILWWNPIVLLLCKKARAFIESSCDQACAKEIGKTQYQQHLAQFILDENISTSTVNNTYLINNFFAKKAFNIIRIKQLSKDYTMNNKNKTTLSIYLLTLLIILTTSMQSFSMKSEEPVVRFEDIKITENQIKIVLDTHLYKYDTNDKDGGIDNFSIAANLVVDLGESFVLKYDKNDFVFKVTPTLLKDGSIFFETDSTFTVDGEKFNHKPSLQIRRHSTGHFTIGGDDGKYTYELFLTIRE